MTTSKNPMPADAKLDWMIEEPLPPIKDTRSKAEKAREASFAREHPESRCLMDSCLQVVCDPNGELHKAFRARHQ